MVQAKKWNVSLRKGKHEGLISFETFERNQRRLKTTGYALARKDIGNEFALRGFAACADCGTSLSSSLSKSCTGRYYPYYLCQRKGCASYGKSIRRAKIEGDFEALLRSLRPSAPLFNVAREMFMDAWQQRGTRAKAIQASLQRTVSDLDAQLDKLLDQMGHAEGKFAMKAFERKAERLERERLITQDRLENSVVPAKAGTDNLELALAFLANPLKLWEKGNQPMRRAVLKMVFVDRLHYCRKKRT